MISFRAHFKVLSILITAGIVFSVSGWGAPAQRERRPAALDSSLYKAMEWRSFGPFRGGRAEARGGGSLAAIHLLFRGQGRRRLADR